MFKKKVDRQTRQPQMNLFQLRREHQTRRDECRTSAHTRVYQTEDRDRKQ